MNTAKGIVETDDQADCPRDEPNGLWVPLGRTAGIGTAAARLLARMGLRRGVDLLFCFPRSYEQVVPVQTVDAFEENVRVSFLATVQEMDERVTQSGKHMLGVQVNVEGGGAARLLWFNQAFRKDGLSPGVRLLVTGVLKSTVLNWELVQPQISLVDSGDDPEHLLSERRPRPVYPLTDGLKQPVMRRVMKQALPTLIPRVAEVLPLELRKRLQVPDITTALEQIHLPRSLESSESAVRRFKAQELLVLQLAIRMQRAIREQASIAPACEPTGKIHARILNRLPFQLTADQARSVQEIGRDMARETPMNRLLQGDVGSGKTIVAQYAMLLCVAHGCQATLMAPTEVLARQHASTLERSLATSRVRVALLTGNMPTVARRDILQRLAAGEIDLLVGTQAILSESVQFQRLGLVIVDEQHKFGVLQRAKLRTDASQPHYLVLSATPIPRTIAMTAFGDLDVSTIRTKPPGRAPVHTYIAEQDALSAWWQFVDRQIESGRQAYVIAPRIADAAPGEESAENTASSGPETGAEASGEVATAEGVYRQLSTETLSHRSVGLLHGRMDSSAKESVLTKFAAGELDVLVATTVVEVGIDVANATLMTILDADRLGLSQLHQLRGRVSRGRHAGFVTAVASPRCAGKDNRRLQAFEESDDGFELAEMDLAIRGPGDLLGTSQSGLPPLRVADLVADAELLQLAHEVAGELLSRDPHLADDQLQALRQQTIRRYGESMQLSDVG